MAIPLTNTTLDTMSATVRLRVLHQRLGRLSPSAAKLRGWVYGPGYYGEPDHWYKGGLWTPEPAYLFPLRLLRRYVRLLDLRIVPGAEMSQLILRLERQLDFDGIVQDLLIDAIGWREGLHCNSERAMREGRVRFKGEPTGFAAHYPWLFDSCSAVPLDDGISTAVYILHETASEEMRALFVGARAASLDTKLWNGRR